MKKYIIHPGFVFSASDRNKHYVGYMQLIRLYGLTPSECVMFDPNQRMPGGLTHLGPQRRKSDYDRIARELSDLSDLIAVWPKER